MSRVKLIVLGCCMVWIIKNCKQSWITGLKGVFQVKQYLALYRKDYAALEDALDVASIVLKGIAPNGAPLIALGYRYYRQVFYLFLTDFISPFLFMNLHTFSSVVSRKITLFFCHGPFNRKKTPGNPHVMQYTDGFRNLCTRDVERPDV